MSAFPPIATIERTCQEVRFVMPMKRILVAATAAAALYGAPVFAADMPVKAPVYRAAAPLYDWSGFYIGGNAGVAINDSRYDLDPAGCFLFTVNNCGSGGLAANSFRSYSAPLNQSAFTGGGQVGYNRQVSSIVFGVEADINYNGIKESDFVIQPLTGPLAGATLIHTVTQRFDWMGTLRGRLGFTPWDRLLVYGTGGLAFGHVSSTTNNTFPPSCCAGNTYIGTGTVTRAGWTAGAGGEYAFGNGWSAKVEYLYIDLGKFNYLDPCVANCNAAAGVGLPASAESFQTTVTTREHIVRVGLNYRFGGL
jgi:outer membrane immunogenic protein